MSTKVYNGIKFKSKDYAEIVSQLHSIREKAIENSRKHFIDDPYPMGGLLIEEKFADSVDELIEMDFETDRNKKWEVRRIVEASLEKRWRKNYEPEFLFSVVVIPWTDGNVYGCFYDDRIHENRELLNEFVDEYHYQNQTDQPDDIDDEEWEERREIWDDIFDKYFTPGEAGFVYEIVKPDDLDIDTVEEAIKSYKSKFKTGYEAICTIKKEIEDASKAVENAGVLDKLRTLPGVAVKNWTWFSKIRSIEVIASDENAANSAMEIIKTFDGIFEPCEFKKSYVRISNFEK
jgi:hypothetical protein